MEIIKISIVVTFLLVFISVTLVIVYYNHKRIQHNQNLAKSLGFVEQSNADPRLLHSIKLLYKNSGNIKLEHLSSKNTPDEAVFLCDLYQEYENSDNGDVDFRTVCVLLHEVELPHFVMAYQLPSASGTTQKLIQQLIKILTKKSGMREVPFSQHEKFSKAYMVLANEPDKVTRIFTQEVLDKLANTTNWLIRAGGDVICFNTYEIRKGEQLTREQLSEHIRSAIQFAHWIQ